MLKTLNFTEAESAELKLIHNIVEQALSPYACKNEDAVREFKSKHEEDVIRTQYSIDTDRILHNPLYNRGADKTQVFSFFRNDDITRRSLHMQLVSRIGRILGKALQLNLDLIEAIAIGHDVGHTPFGHKGEEFLNELYHNNTGRYFNHNVHSVRVLQKISGCNLTLQTLDGILCHCGEKTFEKYEPSTLSTFEEFNEVMKRCYTQVDMVGSLHPSTLEGCIVRISDIIAYVGKDRQDASKAKLSGLDYQNSTNPEIITSVVTDIIKNSLGKPYISMSDETFSALTEILNDNYRCIYQNDEIVAPYYESIKPMMELLYYRFLEDLKKNNYSSPIYKHYLNGSIIGNYYRHYIDRYVDLKKHDANDIVADFIASMTDDYFVDVFAYLFPDNELSKRIKYVEYFDTRYD